MEHRQVVPRSQDHLKDPCNEFKLLYIIHHLIDILNSYEFDLQFFDIFFPSSSNVRFSATSTRANYSKSSMLGTKNKSRSLFALDYKRPICDIICMFVCMAVNCQSFLEVLALVKTKEVVCDPTRVHGTTPRYLR